MQLYHRFDGERERERERENKTGAVEDSRKALPRRIFHGEIISPNFLYIISQFCWTVAGVIVAGVIKFHVARGEIRRNSARRGIGM